MVLLRKRTLEVLGTLYAVKFSKAGPVFIGNPGFMLFELTRIAEVRVDLVNITVVEVSAIETEHKYTKKGSPFPPLGFGATNGAHSYYILGFECVLVLVGSCEGGDRMKKLWMPRFHSACRPNGSKILASCDIKSPHQSNTKKLLERKLLWIIKI